jgi:hypothetical protein
MKRTRGALVAPFLLGLFLPPPGAFALQAQTVDGAVRLVGFTVTPQEPEFGEVFSLRLTLRMPPGVVAFVPDTLVPAAASVSAGPGSWAVAPGPADSTDVQADYPVMGFLNGRVDLPQVELWTRPAVAAESAGPRSLSELGDAGAAATANLRRQTVLVGAVQIAPLQAMAEAGDVISPRPPADVLGGSWSPWFIAAVALSLGIGGTLVWLAAGWLGWTRSGDGEVPTRSYRSIALQELDRIRRLGLPEAGRFMEFYQASTDVLRHFSEQCDPNWGMALTSSELLGQLRDRWGASAVDRLGSAVSVAERAKFGRYRPEVEMSEEHWRTIRGWIEDLPEE